MIHHRPGGSRVGAEPDHVADALGAARRRRGRPREPHRASVGLGGHADRYARGGRRRAARVPGTRDVGHGRTAGLLENAGSGGVSMRLCNRVQGVEIASHDRTILQRLEKMGGRFWVSGRLPRERRQGLRSRFMCHLPEKYSSR